MDEKKNDSPSIEYPDGKGGWQMTPPPPKPRWKKPPAAKNKAQNPETTHKKPKQPKNDKQDT